MDHENYNQEWNLADTEHGFLQKKSYRYQLKSVIKNIQLKCQIHIGILGDLGVCVCARACVKREREKENDCIYLLI